MIHIWSDLRFAFRTLKSRPVFTAVAILSLALGIGANTAIFSVVESSLLRGLPFPDPDQLVYLRDHQPCCNEASLSPGEYLDYQKQSKTFSGLAAYTIQTLTLTGRAEPQRLRGWSVTTNYFEVLGARAELGRLISSKIDKPNSETRVAVIADSAWRSIFASDPNVIGRDVMLNGNSFRIIGVLPTKQNVSQLRDAQIWISPRLTVPEYVEAQSEHMNIAQEYGNHWLIGLGRLKPGVTVSQARAELRTIAAQIARQHPIERNHYAVVFTIQDSLVRSVRPALWVLLTAVVLLLLIACANLAGLSLARAAGRTRELAVRISLGATRRQIIRLLLSESLVLALTGGVIGVALARTALKLITHYSPYDLPAALAPELNVPVLAFCAGVTLLSALFVGLIPAVRAAQIDIQEGLKEGAKGTAGRATRARQALIAAEIAISLMLLTGASLLIHSFSKLISVDPGFDPKHVLTARLSLRGTDDPRDTRTTVFWDRLLPRLATLPGVESAALLTDLPFDGSDSGSYLEFEGHPVTPTSPGLYANEFGASAGTFRALHIPLIAGRTFTARDDAKAPLVAIVNKDLADKAFPHENPLGKRFRGGPVSGWATIVGVVGSIRHDSLDGPVVPDMYFNYPQYGANAAGVVLRTGGASSYTAAELRTAVRQLDPDLPVSNVKPLEDYLGASLSARRFLLGLLTAFSGLAILIAGIGLYGVLAYSVQQRRQEIGIRMTLGATSPDVLWIVLRESFAIAVIGVAAGLLGAAWSASLLKSMLFETTETDILAYSAAVLLVLAIAMAASLVPAWRAARLDPVSALRYE